MEDDGVKLKTDDGKLTGGVATGGVGFGVGDDGVQQRDNSKMGVSDGGVGQKVVSLKGVYTESELEKQQRLEEMKKRAVALDKTEAEIKKEQELEEMKKRAVSLKDGQQLSTGGSQSGVSYHGSKLPPFEEGGIEGEFKSTPNPSFDKGETRKSTPNPSFIPLRQGYEGQASGGEQGRVRTIITPEGRLVELDANEEFSGGQNVVNLKESVSEGGVDEQGKEKTLKNVVDLGSAKSTPNPSFTKGRELKKSTPNPSFDKGGETRKSTPNPSFDKGGETRKSTPNPSLVQGSQFTVHGEFGGTEKEASDNLEQWRKQKVDLSILSPEERLDLQATPSLASVHLKMNDDLNGEVADWFDKYNKLPANIKLGLGDRQTVQQAIKELANRFGVMTEEGLGEISRIVRGIYVDLIGESEIKRRAVDVLKITDSQMNDFLEGIAKIVSLVREVGNKKTDEYFRKLSVEEILKSYPKLAEQEVTTGDIFNKKQQKYVAPTLKNWVDDYINNAGSDKHTSLERAKYLEESYNTKYLEEDDRQAVDMLVKSYDTGSKLLVDSQDDVIYWRLHTDESELGINSDKSKRVINNFKIEEAQKIDVDQEEQNREAENNLEKSGKSSIIEKEQKVADNKKEDVLDLSTELGNNKNLGS